MTFINGLVVGLFSGGITGVSVVISMAFITKRTDRIIAELYEVLVEWTELADNIHLPGRELYERSIKALNRARGW